MKQVCLGPESRKMGSDGSGVRGDIRHLGDKVSIPQQPMQTHILFHPPSEKVESQKMFIDFHRLLD